MTTLLHYIEWAERKLQTNIRYFVRGSFWLISAQGIHFLSTFGLVWIFANLLPKEIYGQYRFLLTVCAILAIATLPGMNVSLTHAVARGFSGTLASIIKTRMLWGLIGSVGALTGSLYYFIQGNHELGSLFLIAAAGVPLYDTFSIYQQYLQGWKNFKLQSILRVLQRFFVVAAVASAVILQQSIIVLFTVFLVASIVSDLLVLKLSLHIHPPNGKVDGEAISYGKSLSLITALRLGAGHLDKIVLWYVAGPVQLATYVVATAIPNELVTASSQMNKLAFPNMAKRLKSEIDARLLQKAALYWLCMIPIFGIYYVVAPFIFSTLFPEYIDAVLLSQIAALSLLLAPAGLFIQYFYAVKNTRALQIVSVLEPVTLILLYFILVPMFGVLGVLYATLGKVTISFLCMIGLFLFNKSSN